MGVDGICRTNRRSGVGGRGVKFKTSGRLEDKGQGLTLGTERTSFRSSRRPDGNSFNIRKKIGECGPRESILRVGRRLTFEVL